MYKIGDRVGAMVCVRHGIVSFLGFGSYQGDEVPPSDIGGYNFGLENPKILLDNGDVIWGCECWWDNEENVKTLLKKAVDVINVSINDYR